MILQDIVGFWLDLTYVAHPWQDIFSLFPTNKKWQDLCTISDQKQDLAWS